MPLRATTVGGTGLVTSGYRQPSGAAGLVTELGAAWLERSAAGCLREALGVGERGLRRRRGAWEQKGKAERGTGWRGVVWTITTLHNVTKERSTCRTG